MNRVHVYTDKWTINKLYKDYFRQGKLDFNTEYQRSEVWNLKKKQRLIDSIVRGYNIGMIFLKKQDGDFYEVLDGQQRLKTIFQFMENKYPTSPEFTPEIGERKYNDIKRDADRYAEFIAFQVDIAFLENADDETTADIFLRLQEGMPLNTAEKLNAMKGKIRNAILELSKHRFIKNTRIKDHRFAHRLLAAQIFKLEMDSNFDAIVFPDIRYGNLREMYRRYSSSNPPQHVLPNTKKYLNFLHKAFGSKAKIIVRRGDFIPLYLLYSYIEKKYASSGVGKEFADFATKFLTKVQSVRIRDGTLIPEDVAYRDYKVWRSAGAMSSKSFGERFRIILWKFFEALPDLEPKDPKRLFDEGQRLAIYHRDKGFCQVCNKEVSLDDAEFDHLTPWSKGGPTTVENGQLLCRECNRKKAS